MDNNNREDSILKYIKGQMSNDERESFEKECKLDPSLLEDVEYHKDIAAVVVYESAKRECNLRKLLKQTEERIQSKQGGKTIPVYWGPVRKQSRAAAIIGEDEDLDAGEWLKQDSKGNKGKSHLLFYMGWIVLIVIIIIAIIYLLTLL